MSGSASRTILEERKGWCILVTAFLVTSFQPQVCLAGTLRNETFIEFDELAEKKDEFFIIDVRSPGELEQHGFIPGSHNIPIAELENAIGLDDEAFSEKYGFDKPKLEDTVVTMCHIGGRARRAGAVMIAAGYMTRVYGNSFSDWKANGGEIEFKNQ